MKSLKLQFKIQKFIFFFIFLFLIPLLSEKIRAAGEPCCDYGWFIDPLSKFTQCITVTGPGGKRSTNCKIGEYCEPTSVFPDQGICQTPPPTGPSPTPRIYCGALNQPCCPPPQILRRWYCFSPYVPSDPGSSSCICKTSLPPQGGPIDFNKLKKAFPSGSLPAMDNLTIGFLISKAVTYLFIIAGLLLLFLLISAGLQIMVGAADPKAKEGASKKITNALIGFLILFVSYWLVQIIELVLGISILK